MYAEILMMCVIYSILAMLIVFAICANFNHWDILGITTGLWVVFLIVSISLLVDYSGKPISYVVIGTYIPYKIEDTYCIKQKNNNILNLNKIMGQNISDEDRIIVSWPEEKYGSLYWMGAHHLENWKFEKAK